jgi:hypothetical protein
MTWIKQERNITNNIQDNQEQEAPENIHYKEQSWSLSNEFCGE